MARASFALMLANLRYWTTVTPSVREQLLHWEQRAQAIPDPVLRGLAQSKLRLERFNVEAAATLATLATPPTRRDVVRAIVALQVMYDYLDLLTEQPVSDLALDGSALFEAFIDAVTPGGQPQGDYYRHHPQSRDGGYLRELVSAVRVALARLPARDSVEAIMRRGAKRCAQAQVRCHAAGGSTTTELERWAAEQARNTCLQWPELLAGAAASVLAIHALIAAAADPRTTQRDAENVDTVYLSIGALTMLDSIVDQGHDLATGELNYVQLYQSRELMVTSLANVARNAKGMASTLPNAAHHIVTLVGVVAYYSSAVGAPDIDARRLTEPIHRELKPLMTPTLALLRIWRLAKWARRRWRISPAALTQRRLERSSG